MSVSVDGGGAGVGVESLVISRVSGGAWVGWGKPNTSGASVAEEDREDVVDEGSAMMLEPGDRSWSLVFL